MKLQTSIKPRRDGTVKVTGQDRQTYVFLADSDGELSCDVTDTATVTSLLAGGEFWPANPDDHDAAMALAADDAGDDDSDDDADDAGDMNTPPIEANTPPVIRRKPGPKPKAK
jgi:hypothetical protein